MDCYGVMTEGTFISSEVNDEMSIRQKSALAKMNESLKNGVLKDPVARRDRAVVRRELDKAWELTPGVVSQLNRVFGPSVTRTLDRSTISTSPCTASAARRTIKVALRKIRRRSSPSTATLKDALGDGGGWSRPGTLRVAEASYPTSPTSRRAMQVRVQKALHDKMPVVVSWYVDFNALGRDSKFSKSLLEGTGPDQGGHMTVMHDYEADGHRSPGRVSRPRRSR